MSDLVAIGEATALFSHPHVGRLRDARNLDVSIAGAEANVSIGFSRLGRSSSWIGRVGNDEFGHMILKTLRAEGVDVAGAVIDETHQTALMFKERSADNMVRVNYYRRGYAGSALEPDDLDTIMIESSRVLHVTGITLALSETAREAVRYAMEVARASGVTVSFDFNYRSRLWSPEEAAAVIGPLAQLADIVFAGEDELFVLGTDEMHDAMILADDGRREVVIKRGARGATSISSSGVLHEPALSVRAVDPVGAGDAFVAGYLVAHLDGEDPAARLKMGCATGAFAASRLGDWECLPRRDDLDLLVHESGATLR
ncbi:MAG TPA: sugar kinase [Acidimicrobiales bacterium]